MANCAMCGKLVPANEMRSNRSAFGGLGGGNDMLGNIMGAMNAATTAWSCSSCREWICNSCVCKVAVGTGNQYHPHQGCGGMFKPPA